MAKEGELSFRLDILTYFKFNLRNTPFAHMTTIAIYVRLGVTDVAGKFIAVNIMRDTFGLSGCGIRMAPETGRLCLSLKTRRVNFPISMKLCNPVAIKTLHLHFFPMDIR